VEPTDYKPRHNNYTPLRDLEQKAPQAQAKAVEEQSQHEAGKDSKIPRLKINMQGGPSPDAVSIMDWGHQQVQAKYGRHPEQIAAKERTPAADRVKQSAERKHEAPDPSIARTKSNEIER
jgi:hypothetical protein